MTMKRPARGLKDFFEQTGITIDDASDGKMALRKLEEHDFAVVLLDVQLPGIGGT